MNADAQLANSFANRHGRTSGREAASVGERNLRIADVNAKTWRDRRAAEMMELYRAGHALVEVGRAHGI